MSSKSSPKLKPLPRPLFSCGIFRNCTQSVLSPTSATAPPQTAAAAAAAATASPPPPSPPPPPPPPPPPAPSDQRPPPSSSSSSSSSTSPSFTQWRFPLHHPSNTSTSASASASVAAAATANNHNESVGAAAAAAAAAAGDVFGAADAQFRSDAPLVALRLLEKSLAAASASDLGSKVCPKDVMAGVVSALRDPASARPAAKVLLAMLLVEANRLVAVEAGAVAAAVEAIASSAAAAGGSTATNSTAERALAALELMCTIDKGSSEIRSHALAAPAMAGAVEGMQGRGRECAIGVLAAVYGSGGERAKEAPEEVVRAVMLAMQGECSTRGTRKGAMLLRALQECGRLDLDLNFAG